MRCFCWIHQAAFVAIIKLPPQKKKKKNGSGTKWIPEMETIEEISKIAYFETIDVGGKTFWQFEKKKYGLQCLLPEAICTIQQHLSMQVFLFFEIFRHCSTVSKLAISIISLFPFHF